MSEHFIVNTSLLNRPHSGIARYLKGIYTHWPKSPEWTYPIFFNGKHTQPHLDVAHSSDQHWFIPVVKKYVPFSYRIKSIVQSRHLNRVIQKQNVFLYHEPNFIPLRTNLPTCVTIHDLAFLKFPETLPQDRRLWLSQNISKALHNSRRIFTVSETIKNELLNHYHLEPQKIVPIFNSISKEFTTLAKSSNLDFIEKLGLQHKKFLLFVGNVEPRKNLHFLLDLYQSMSESFKKSCPLVIVGSSHLYARYSAPLLNSIKSHNFHFLSGLSDLELFYLYHSASCLVFPSLYEGFGLPILESLTSGTPVIASKIAVFEELFPLGTSLIDLNNLSSWKENIIKMYESSPLVTQSTKAHYFKEFSWEKSALKMAQEFNTLKNSPF